MKTGVSEPCQTQITTIEKTVTKGDAGKVGVVQVAVNESTFFVKATSGIFFVKGDLLECPVFAMIDMFFSQKANSYMVAVIEKTVIRFEFFVMYFLCITRYIRDDDFERFPLFVV